MDIPGKGIVLIAVVSAIAGGYIERQFVGSGSILKDTITKNKDVTTIIKEKKNKDGSTESETTIVDKSKEKEQLVATTPGKAPDWFLQAGGTLGGQDAERVYMGSLSRRILGPVHLGVWATSDKRFGALLGLQF